MFNARNELDQSRFVDDLGESIAEMDEMESIKVNNISETIHFKYLERLKRHAMMHSGSNENIQPNQIIGIDNHQVTNKMLSMINSCDIVNNKKSLPGSTIKNQENSALNVTNVDENCGIKTKFNSMLNLSSSSGDSKSDNNDKQKPSKGLRQNKSFINHPQQIVEQPTVNQTTNSSLGSADAQRKCSTSSVHSLDSGLFLSRDVSPNQSS